ncbi:phage tail assembly protein [Serratia sp. JSRIV006]|uniref:phage tail assembly protein n=1 Tax=Serratia sp. JSRIV006 TaxID=2831896 RepID=UPI001CBBAF34|nr:phage tail assembly protein [Serratia sp. JSRIV006]UAN61538.1 phage tail assembly protein [Serratia sp. JSRIV006]
MLEEAKTITLKKPLETAGGKLVYSELELKEPVLVQAEQFYERREQKGALNAMRLLISLVSGVPEGPLANMHFTDYKRCEVYMLGFLSFDPSKDGSS